nr:hypothetical protein [Tanacetum cinerariifolium]
MCVEYDHVGMARAEDVAIKAKNGFDAFHIATKQGDLGIEGSELIAANNGLINMVDKKETSDNGLINKVDKNETSALLPLSLQPSFSASEIVTWRLKRVKN